MMRTIAGFRLDVEHHWVADLSCGHSRHMRHDPPWQLRPWVLTPAGRANFVGHELECAQCDGSDRMSVIDRSERPEER